LRIFDFHCVFGCQVLLAPKLLVRTVVIIILSQEISLVVRIRTVLIEATLWNIVCLIRMNGNCMKISIFASEDREGSLVACLFLVVVGIDERRKGVA
jgi:hypothetical protein